MLAALACRSQSFLLHQLTPHCVALQRVNPVNQRGMAEFYVNEVLSHPFTFNLDKTSKFGVADLAASGAVTAVKAWKMTLPGDQE